MATCLHVAYWSDPLCVWAFVGQARVDAVLASRNGARLTLDHHIVPVFGSVPHRFRAGAWAEAGPQGRADVTRRVASRFGHHDITGQVWLDDPPTSSWAVSAAFKGAQLLEAREEAPEGSASRYLWRLRTAFFEDNRNTSRRGVQLELAEETGVPIGGLVDSLDDGSALAALYEDHQERERQRIQGSPTWVFDGGRAMLYGNFAEEILHSTVEALVKDLEPGGSPCNC